MQAPSEKLADEFYDQAVEIFREQQCASVSMLQRKLRIGFITATRIVDRMEQRGLIGPFRAPAPHEVYLKQNSPTRDDES